MKLHHLPVFQYKILLHHLAVIYPFTPNPGTIPDPMDWAEEGKGLAETVSYVNITENTSPSTAYLNTTKATAEQRMAIGGKRLADLLNTLFAPPLSGPITITWLPSTNGNFEFSWNAVSGITYHV